MSVVPVAVEVFCSYAQEDEIWLRKLETHLSLLKRQGFISIWHNRLLLPGIDWSQAIDDHLETASIILLLISADFLASDYCYGVEMKRALDRQKADEAQVIPLLLRPVDWTNSPFAHLQVLPTDAKPLATQEQLESAFAVVAVSLRRIIEELSSLSASFPQAALPGIWNVPYLRNPHFTGRDELLDQLHQQLSPKAQNDSTATCRVALTQPQAIKGLGGIGKTQIAIEYAYRSREQGHYIHTFWVNAASEETLLTSFVALAKLLPRFPAKNETDQQKLVVAIKRWLEQSNQRWLLIFDNADEVSLIREYFPQQGSGSILLTTRADAVGSLAASVDVRNMGLIEGTELLLRRAQHQQASDEERNLATNVVIALDCFPLALDQAGAYIEETRCSFVEYLKVYQDHRKELLARRGEQATSYPSSVATTWSLSFQKVEQANPAAAELLRLCAYLSPDRIPEELIRDGATHWNPPLQHAVTDLFTFNQMIEELLKFSLVKRLSETYMFSIHRLVQVVQIDSMELEVQRQWAVRVVLAVNEVFPRTSRDVATWPQCLRYLEQAQACDVLIQQHMIVLTEASDLLQRTAEYLQSHASYATAEPLYQRALGIRELQVASSLNGLAILYWQQGRHAQAEPLYQRALHVREQQLGPEHPDVASSLNGLAILYWQQGKYAQAEPLYQRALHIREQQLGPEHPHVASSINNLAVLYYDQGKYAQAEPLYQRALHIREQQLGPEHTDVASSLNGLATLYYVQGKYAQAEPLYQRALHIFEQQLGPEHPMMASPLHNLAELYREQGKYGEAELLCQRALHIREQQFDPDHPDVALSLYGLALLYTQQGKYGETELLYQRALHIREQQFGPDHPDVAFPLNGLATLYTQQGKYEQAELLFLRALNIREQQLGPDHPDTAQTLHDLARFWETQGNSEEARAWYARALTVREQVFGRHHPKTTETRLHLITLLCFMGQYEEAAQLEVVHPGQEMSE